MSNTLTKKPCFWRLDVIYYFILLLQLYIVINSIQNVQNWDRLMDIRSHQKITGICTPEHSKSFKGCALYPTLKKKHILRNEYEYISSIKPSKN